MAGWTRLGRPDIRTDAGRDWQSAVMGTGSQPPPGIYIALTADTTAPASSDTALSSELAAYGMGRALAVYAHTTGTNAYTLTHIFTATGTVTVGKYGIFNQNVGGTLIFESLEPQTYTLQAGQSLAQIVTVSI